MRCSRTSAHQPLPASIITSLIAIQFPGECRTLLWRQLKRLCEQLLRSMTEESHNANIALQEPNAFVGLFPLAAIHDKTRPSSSNRRFSTGPGQAGNEARDFPLILPIRFSETINQFPLLKHQEHVSRRERQKDQDVQSHVIDDEGVGN